MTTQDAPEVLDNDENAPSGLRATIERLTEANKEKDAELARFRAKERAEILEKAGLDPTTQKAVAKDIERGDFKEDLTIETVQSYARAEWDWTPPEGDKPAVPDDAAQRLAATQARDDVMASSVPIDETDDSPEAAQAEVDEKLEQGDVQGSILAELNAKVDRAT